MPATTVTRQINVPTTLVHKLDRLPGGIDKVIRRVKKDFRVSVANDAEYGLSIFGQDEVLQQVVKILKSWAYGRDADLEVKGIVTTSKDPDVHMEYADNNTVKWTFTGNFMVLFLHLFQDEKEFLKKHSSCKISLVPNVYAPNRIIISCPDRRFEEVHLEIERLKDAIHNLAKVEFVIPNYEVYRAKTFIKIKNQSSDVYLALYDGETIATLAIYARHMAIVERVKAEWLGQNPYADTPRYDQLPRRDVTRPVAANAAQLQTSKPSGKKLNGVNKVNKPLPKRKVQEEEDIWTQTTPRWEVAPFNQKVTRGPNNSYIKYIGESKNKYGQRRSTYSINGKLAVHIYVGPLARARGVDAIVAAVTTGLEGGQRLTDIEMAGGNACKSFLSDLRKGQKSYRVGEVITSVGGNLRKYILLAVMSTKPMTTLRQVSIWLRSIIIRIMETADSWGFQKIAMPLLGVDNIALKTELESVCLALLEELVEMTVEMGDDLSLQEIHLVDNVQANIQFLNRVFQSKAIPSLKLIGNDVGLLKTGSGPLGRSDANFLIAPREDRLRRLKREAELEAIKANNPPPVSKSANFAMTKRHNQVQETKSESMITSSTERTRKTYPLRKSSSTKSLPYDSWSLNERGVNKGGYRDMEVRRREIRNAFINSPPQNSTNSSKNNNASPKVNARTTKPSVQKTTGKPNPALAPVPAKQDQKDQKRQLVKCELYNDCHNPGILSFPCGHMYCDDCSKLMNKDEDCIKCKSQGKTKKKERVRAFKEGIVCPICTNYPREPRTLPCGHVFCKRCLSEVFRQSAACPTCGMIFGNQPDGKMEVFKTDSIHLPGYEEYGVIVIDYSFPDGVQKENHIHPGRRYKALKKKAYLPDNPEGQKVLKLLQVAWDRKLIFTVGDEKTGGMGDVIKWNGIIHKTNTHGGPRRNGYPDFLYLDRIKADLWAKGVTENSLR